MEGKFFPHQLRSFFAGGCELSSHLFDDPGDDAPDEEIVVRADGYGFILGVLLVAGQQDRTVLVDLHALDCVLAVDEADGLAAVVRIDAAVHDDDVAFVHVSVHHRDTVDAEEEGRGAMLHQQFHQVKLFPNFLCRRRETGLDGAGEGELKRVAV